jgi:lactoylglutathione lyase
MISAVSHVGIRVLDSERSEAFYAKLIVNAVPDHDGTNVLMDENLPKRAGYTHVAFAVSSIEETVTKLGELGIAMSGGPERLGPGISLFVRDPDRNVLELRQERAG